MPQESVDAPSVLSPEISKFNLFQFLGVGRAFKIPSYQREYAWGHEQIESLCDDLREFHESGDNYYLLGQLILARNQDADAALYPLAVVDGQQRLTSILLLLVALRDALRGKGAVVGGGTEPGRMLQAVITALEEIDSANGSPRLRVRLGDHGHDYLSKLFKGDELPEIDLVTTHKNVRDNFHFIEAFLEKNFDLLPDLTEFAKKVLYKVFIIETLLEGEEQALDIFEKLNSRGLPLNSADLLKNLLFQQAKTASYDALSRTWTSAVENVFKIKPNKAASVEYVMKAMLGARTGVGTGKKGVYKAWKEKFKNDEVTLSDFASDLEKTAKHLRSVTSSKSTSQNKDLFGCRYFGTVQHLPLVVAGMKFHKNEDSHRLFCQLVEARLMTYLFSEEKTQLFEAIIWPWANNIYNLGSDPSPEEVIDASTEAFASQDTLLSQGRLHFRNYRYTSTRDSKRIRFVLAEVSHALEKRALQPNPNGTAEDYLLAKSGTTGYHLDHIFPKSTVENNPGNLGEDTSWVHAPGNLTLLHAQDNIHAGAADAATKSRDYASSKLLLTNSLALDSDLGALNNRLTDVILESRALGNPNVGDWNKFKIQGRTEYLWTEFEAQISLAKFSQA